VRLARLDLDRYGRFTDVSLPLPRQATDLHVIYGPNEAGKSTTRKGLTELLYGFEKSTPFAFLHDYSELRLRACIESGEEHFEIVRRKTNRNSLLDPAGQPIDDELWRRLVGTSDRAFFERMFALDHTLLVAGGRAMLDSHSDVGRMLFQAAAGLSHFNQVRAEISSEAGQWWAGRAKKDVRYFEARSRLEAASKALKEHGLSETALATLQRELAQAQAKEDAARARRVEAHVRIIQLERIRRVAPKLQQLAMLDTQCESAGASKLLPPDARDTFRAYTRDTAAADSAAHQLVESIDEQVLRRDELRVDEALLAQAETIDALAGELSSVEKEVTDLPKRKVEREQLRRELAQAVADLGLPPTEPAGIPAKLPRAAQRERMRAMASDHADQQKGLAARMASVETASGAVAALRNDLARVPADGERPWGRLIAAAASVLESANARQLAEAAAAADTGLRDAIEALGWTGAPESLRAVQPPADTDIASRMDALSEQRTTLTELARGKREVDAQIAQVDAQIDVLQQDAVPDAAALQGARGARDSLLGELIAGTRSLAAEGESFRDLVHAADEIADRRYAEAEAAARIDGLLANQAGLRAKALTLIAQADDATQRIEQVQAEWQQAATAAGLPNVALEAAQGWLERRRRVLQALDGAERARSVLDAFAATAEREASRLAEALVRERPGGVGAAAWLQTLLNDARAALQDATGRQARRTELARQIDEQASLIAREQAAVAVLNDSQAGWQREWEIACKDAGLPAETQPRSLDRVLETIEDLRSKAARFTEQVEARIQPMERNVAAFGVRVAECVKLAAPTLADRQPFDAVRLLAKGLQSARDASRTRATLDQSIDGQRAKLRLQQQNREAAHARLGPLLQVAGVADATELEAAIAASEERRRAEAARDQMVESILEHGDGRDLAQLRAEVAGVEVDQLEALLAESNTAHTTADEQQQAAQAEAVLARNRLQQLEGNDYAARARTAKATAQREMADAVEAFIGLQTQTQLLDWALKRYREEKQAPLLLRAGEYFAKLTCDQHVRLLAEEDGLAVTLASRRAGQGGGRVGVDEMSEGTRDQLFLALRLAALELHLERNVALPFVADDLLVNFDDARAKAAIGCLADLSQRTQVLYFTHHRHLIDLAREAVGGELNVIELEL